MQHGWFELQVLVAGHPVREYGHQGKTFVEGRKGTAYTLRFRNSLAQRVLAVPSIDGLSALDGQPATDASNGYIVPAYASVEIKGWRPNLEQVAAFVFTDRSQSYASQSGTGQNLGVIGVKVFAEYQPTVRYISTVPMWAHGGPCGAGMGTAGDPAIPSFTTCSMDLASASASTERSSTAFNLGTGWGETKADHVMEAPFQRGVEMATLDIYYDDADGLGRHGITLAKEPAIALPASFNSFCKPPKITV